MIRPARRRGFALVDGLLAVGLTAACVHGLYIAHRIFDHYAEIGGTVAAFAHFVNAHHSFFQANPEELTIPNFNELVSDGHLTGATLLDSTTAHLDNTDHIFEIQTIHGQSMLTTVVEQESQAQRITRMMGYLATYEVEDPFANTFRVRLATLRTPSLETLIETKSMHVRGSTNRLVRLNFSQRATKTVGATCQPEPGIWMGGLAISAAGKLVVCQRIYSDREPRVWRIAGSYTSNPYPTNRCGDGTIVSNANNDCKNCWDGSNVHISSACPVQPRCGDGVLVANASTECKDCWNGSNIHISNDCPTQSSCGDGTFVLDSISECKDCWDGSNIHVSKDCPTEPPIQYCDDGTPVTDRLRWCEDCWDGSNVFLTTPSSCPPLLVQQYCGDGSTVTDAVTDCQDCWDGSNIPTTSTCPVQPACGDGTPVSDTSTDCKDCPGGQNIPIASTCPIVSTCGDGTIVSNPSTECKNCLCGENIHVSATCPMPSEMCDDGTKVCDASIDCKDCWDMSNIHVLSSCPAQPTCDDGTPVTNAAIECKTCECGQNIHIDSTCPLPPETCGDGTSVCNPATDCKDCWNGDNIALTSSCPAQPTCGDGTLVTDPTTQCKTCCDGNTVAISASCPSLTYTCAEESASYPNCCCSTMTPIESQNMCSVVWSCPPKPMLGGIPEGFSDPRFVVVTTEHECHFSQTLVCIADVGSCYGPSNYCADIRPVFYGGGRLCDELIVGVCDSTGYVCGESTFGP